MTRSKDSLFAPIRFSEETVPLDALDKYVGQDRIKEIIKIHAKHFFATGETFPHTLLFGNAGLGKTTLAKLLAETLGVEISLYTGGGLNKIELIEALVLSVRPNQIVFIDEIHRLPIRIEEELYSVMQDFYYGHRVVPKFTLVGATTSAGKLSKPFLDRFVLDLDVEDYSEKELVTIIKKRYDLSDTVCKEIAQRAKGVPRIALKISHTTSKADMPLEKIFKLLKLDTYGLSHKHRRILRYLYEASRPVGLESVAYGCDIDKTDLISLYERDLVKLGLVLRTPRGRLLTGKGRDYITREESK